MKLGDFLGLPASITLANGFMIALELDRPSKRIRIIGPDGKVTALSCNAEGDWEGDARLIPIVLVLAEFQAARREIADKLARLSEQVAAAITGESAG